MEIRDKKGNLEAYQFGADAKTALEVIITRYDERLARIDSNISDLKYNQATQSSDIKKLFEKMSETLQSFHEALGQISSIGKKNIEISNICADYARTKLEREANYKFLKWAAGVISGIAGLAIAAWAAYNKK
jgi:hypothetical protein